MSIGQNKMSSCYVSMHACMHCLRAWCGVLLSPSAHEALAGRARILRMPKSKLSGLFNRRRRRDGDSSPTPTQTSEQVSNTNPNEPALQNPSEATATSVDSKTSNDSDAVSEKLWSRAFELLRDREETLVDDYERCLNEKGILGLQEPPIRSGVLFKPGFVKDVVQTFKNDREKKQWTFSLKGKDHKLRDQLEKLVKLLVFSDSILKQATSAQPYAALAWSTASVFLPVCPV